MTASWPFWAILSAIFAAATAILGKVGVADIGSNLATFIRTIVILILTFAIALAAEKWSTSPQFHARLSYF